VRISFILRDIDFTIKYFGHDIKRYMFHRKKTLPSLLHLQKLKDTFFIPNYKTFNFFDPKFDHSSYLKKIVHQFENNLKM